MKSKEFVAEFVYNYSHKPIPLDQQINIFLESHKGATIKSICPILIDKRDDSKYWKETNYD